MSETSDKRQPKPRYIAFFSGTRFEQIASIQQWGSIMITRTLQKPPAGEVCGYLHVPRENGAQVIEIGEFVSIGRDPGNLVALNDDCVSNRHARIERKPNGFLLRDLRSRNGTYVNGARVFEALLADRDVVRVGQLEMTFAAEIELPHDNTLVSKNPRWQKQLEKLTAAAQSGLPVLLTGASGTGKEVLATELHRRSRRTEGPLVSVNCCALSESLVESELFGHVKGSFTGATVDRKGAFEAARGGTLFLDEIGDLPLSLQPKLLRALENRQIRPVGSDRTIETDVRIIAATHHHLREKVGDGSFRRDLYFRLNVVPIENPAARGANGRFRSASLPFCEKLSHRLFVCSDSTAQIAQLAR